MALVFTRILALFTLFSYLAVGTVFVRVYTAQSAHFSLDLEYFSLFNTGTLVSKNQFRIEAPDQKFADLIFSEKKKLVASTHRNPEAKRKAVASVRLHKVNPASLPFHEPIMLEKVVTNMEMPSKLLVLYRPAPEEIVEMVAQTNITIDGPKETATDEVSTQMARSEIVQDILNDEPTFLDYSEETAPAEVSNAVSEAGENSHTVSDPGAMSSVNEAVDKKVETVDKVRGAVDNDEELIAFDYSSVNKAISDKKIPTVSTVTTQYPSQHSSQPVPTFPAREVEPSAEESKIHNKSKKIDPTTAPGYSSEVSIHAAGTNLKKTKDVSGFEIRFHDDLSAAIQDYGTGTITLKELLAQPSMTRSAFILKPGYAPTHTDLILENGVSEISLPLIEEHTFNDLLSSHDPSSGAVLVELDDETELAKLDVGFGEVILLNGDMKITTANDHRYQLFVGVKAGNALLSYQDFKGEIVSKVIHIHSRELTFEANIYEKSSKEVVTLFEENLLAREKAPLIIGAQQVKKFATDVESKKISDHSHKVNFGRHLLASRRYLEVGHQEEPVFVGLRDVSKLVIPSEHFMRFVLSRLEGAALGNRCLVQVNLSKRIERVDVGAESQDGALETFTQMLDTDGKFHDSVSDKTRKVIIVGENQGSTAAGQEGKINLKVTYLNGTVQYLGSYCSPNTYMVEQL